MNSLTKRQREIVDAALDIVSTQGLPRMTVKNLARSLGVSEPALYRHFRSKFDILLAILKEYKGEFAGLVDKYILNKTHAADSISALYRELFRWFKKQPSMSMVLFSDEFFRHDKRLSKEAFAIIEMTHERIYGILREGSRNGQVRRDVPARQLAWMVMGSVRLLVTRWRMSGFKMNLVREGDIMLGSLRRVLEK